MKERYAIVVNNQGYKNEFVLVETVSVPILDNDGNPTEAVEPTEIPHGYTLQNGESLIYDDISAALAMQRPRWNGQSWDETATDEELEALLPPLEYVRAGKLSEIGVACEAAIHAGVTIQTQNGAEHFSLTINDQTNIANLAAQAQAGATVLYHADGELCRPFTPDEMLTVATKAIEHKTRHTTLCNHYNVWVRRVQNRDELAAITYGSPLPSDLAESMKALMGWGNDNE